MTKTIVFALAFLAVCQSYTVKYLRHEGVFPVQMYLPKHPQSFQRFYNNRVEIVECPEGYSFDLATMVCQLDAISTDLDIDGSCPLNYRGLVADPFNCRNFINCHDGAGALQECAAHTLFSTKKNACEWPEESGCCEYPEGLSNSY